MQFIVLAFNHEKYIIEHLESIRLQIERFASESCSISVIDDCSRDETVKKANMWMKRNGHLFEKSEIISSSRNAGINRNFIKAISSISESRFKILAGDDLYAMNNVFEVVGEYDLLETPVISFSEGQVIELSEKQKIEFCYRYGMRPASRKVAKRDLSSGIQFSAPGVFLSRRVVEDDGLQEYISQYKAIEDLPMWHYLLNIRREQTTFGKTAIPYAMHRVGSGVSTSSSHEMASQYKLDEERIRRIACPDFYKTIKRQKNRWGRIIRKTVYLPAYATGIGNMGNCRCEYKNQWAKANMHLKLIQARASDFENGIAS